MEMSRTYKVLRNKSDFSGVKKVWVLYNKRGAKKFQQIVNKRCRRLDKIAIAEGINDMVDDKLNLIFYEMIEEEDIFFEDLWYWDKDDVDEDWAFEDDLEDDYFDSEEDIYDPYWVDPLDWCH